MAMGEETIGADMGDVSKGRPRLVSLDVFRGLVIAGMIVVNNPGSWQSVHPPLRHATWDGWTPTDLVFPSFLLIVGVAIPFSLKKRSEGPGWIPRVVWRIVRRSVVIFGLGLLLNGFPEYHLATLRIPGVLQRIAVCYFFASIAELILGTRGKAWLAAFLLLGYWAAMTFVAAPGHATGDLSREGNLAAAVDRAVLPGHLYKADYDPEGLLSTLPAIATTLIGVLAGHWLRSGRSPFEIAAGLSVGGWFSLMVGWIWGAAFPINKALWTSSFVMLTAGLGLQMLAAVYWLVDLRGWRTWSRPFAILGMNAIAAYVLAAVLARLESMARWADVSGGEVSLKGRIVRGLEGLSLTPSNASLAHALLFLAVCFLPVWLMDRKGIYVRA